MVNQIVYTIDKLASLADISVRTLRHYDQIGLLSPVMRNNAGHRVYGTKELLRLQQILFFKELDFPLQEIQAFLKKDLDLNEVLRDQKVLLIKKIDRLNKLVKNIDSKILDINRNTMSKTDDLYDGFSEKEIEQYKKEAQERWGNTPEFRESVKRYERMTKEDISKIKHNQVDVAVKMSELKDIKSPEDPEVQDLVSIHYKQIQNFYTPTKEIYSNLGKMYVGDERFTQFYDKYGKGTAEFLNKAIQVYCENPSNF